MWLLFSPWLIDYLADIMSSKLQHIPLPVNSNKHTDSEIEQISAGSTISSAVLSQGGGLYCWGVSGTSSYRTPLPIKVGFHLLC